MVAIFNIENRWTHLHLWLDYNSLVPDKNWWVNIKIYPKNIKKKIVDEFADLLPIEKKLFDNQNTNESK